MMRFFLFVVVLLLFETLTYAKDSLYHPPKLEEFRPYFSTGPMANAKEALMLGNASKAIPLLHKYLRQKNPAHAQQARFLLAYSLLSANTDLEKAVQLFNQLTTQYPLLHSYHKFYQAKALYKLRQFKQAESITAGIEKTSVLYIDAQLLRAEALMALNQLDKAEKIWTTYLNDYPNGQRRAEAHFKIGEILEAQASKDKRKLQQAIKHYLEAAAIDPLRQLFQKAYKHAVDLAQQLPKIRATFDSDQMFTQSLVFYRTMRNVQAEKGFDAVLQQKDLSPQMRCEAAYYRANSVFKQRQRDRAVPLFEYAENHCRRAKIEDFVVKSIYNIGRGLMRKNEFQKAAEKFINIEKEFSKHSYADDARLRAAEAYKELDKKEEVTKLLSKIPTKYPKGDMAREALWRLAHFAYLDGDLEKALSYLDRSINELGRAKVYYAKGQDLYWKARILSKMGKSAWKYYARCIQEYPLSYYALLAFNRLRESNTTLYNKLLRQLIHPIGQKSDKWILSKNEILKEPAVQRGIELARLGLSNLAAQELAKAGLRTNSKDISQDKLWLAAILLDQSNLWHLSHQVPRRYDTTYKQSYPLGENYRRWTISYPLAFPAPVNTWTSQNSIPNYLAWAVMREESGFNQKIESYANAIGLMQIILPTARAAAQRHNTTVDRSKLQDPNFNIKIGTTFLGWLYKNFNKAPALAIAGYNAGQGAVYRWLRNFPKIPMDEFVERIPYEQTRRYTKRVLSSYFAYSVLYSKPKQIPRIKQNMGRVVEQNFGKTKK